MRLMTILAVVPKGRLGEAVIKSALDEGRLRVLAVGSLRPPGGELDIARAPERSVEEVGRLEGLAEPGPALGIDVVIDVPSLPTAQDVLLGASCPVLAVEAKEEATGVHHA
jgi:hypothetical protein